MKRRSLNGKSNEHASAAAAHNPFPPSLYPHGSHIHLNSPTGLVPLSLMPARPELRSICPGLRTPSFFGDQMVPGPLNAADGRSFGMGWLVSRLMNQFWISDDSSRSRVPSREHCQFNSLFSYKVVRSSRSMTTNCVAKAAISAADIPSWPSRRAVRPNSTAASPPRSDKDSPAKTWRRVWGASPSTEEPSQKRTSCDHHQRLEHSPRPVLLSLNTPR